MFKFIRKLIGTTVKALLLIAVIGCAIFAYARLVEPYALETQSIKIDGEHIANNQNVKIVHFGDTHLGFDYNLERLGAVIDEINGQNPDIIVFTGDLIDDLNSYDGDKSEISAALSMLNAPFGKFAVHGNHDYEMSADDPYADIMENGGFTVLRNESVYIPELNINVYGIEDCLIGGGDTSILASAGPETYNLVLCHEPDVFDEMLGYNISLVLSGHSHGGQVKIPVYTEQFLPPLGHKYVSGLYTEKDKLLYVTKGIGTTKLPLRFMAKPEIVSISVN